MENGMLTTAAPVRVYHSALMYYENSPTPGI